MNAKQLLEQLPATAFAFRGYNITNLGRSHELLAHKVYGPTVREFLKEASRIHAEVTGRRTNLVERVRRRRETSLRTYSQAIALIVAMELAQLKLLDEHFGIAYSAGKLAFGYSLGELTALTAGGSFEMGALLQIPLSLAPDCVELAKDVTLAVLFSRARIVPTQQVRRLCHSINREGRGVVDISAYLSPNSMLLMGQGDTLDRFRERMDAELSVSVYLRKNDQRWPPLHTCIVWEKCIPGRSGILLHTLPGGLHAPTPPVFSLITGTVSYDDYNIRDLLCRWSDQPQRLWDAVNHIVASDVTTIVHVGPQPNIIPATFTRLQENVVAQTKASLGMRALSVARPWLKGILPARTALLRAPLVRNIILEDWLLEQDV